MKRILGLLASMIICLSQLSVAQSSRYLRGDNSSADTPADAPDTKGSAFLDWSEEKEALDKQMDDFVKNYHYASPTTTTYDSILLNTRGFEPDEVPTYSAEVIQARLNELPMVIAMDYNIFVQRYIDTYSLRRRDQVSRMMGLGKVYFPMFEQELDKRDMPLELKYLPVVESALNPHARSRVGATGMWQFMLGTARMYGLKVNSFVDERKDPYKSTVAALDYLQASKEEFGDWLLAIASYNCGPGNVRKAILRSGGKRNFWEIRKYLPRETRGYVPAFIAATYVFEHASDHNIYPTYVDYDYRADTLELRNLDITLSEIAEMCKVDVQLLKTLNPELKLDRIPYSSAVYTLNAPRKVANYFAMYPYRIQSKYGKKRDQYIPPVQYTASSSSSSSRSYSNASYSPKNGEVLVYYTVRTGDVVGSIAEKYGVSARQISYWNNLRRYRIKVGQKLKIYTQKSKATAAGATSSPSVAPKPNYVLSNGMQTHTVKRGETLWSISNKYSVPLETLYSLNKGLKNSKLNIGQVVRVR